MLTVLSADALRAFRARCGETPATACVDAIRLARDDGTMHSVLHTLAVVVASANADAAGHCAAVLECVRVLCWHPDAAATIVSVAGVASSLVRAMTQHASTAKVQRAGCAALASFAAQGGAGRGLAVEAGAPDAVMHALTTFPHKAAVQSAAAAALLTLVHVDDDVREAVARAAGGAAAIAAALGPVGRAPPAPQTCVMLCRVLHLLAASRDVREALKASDAVTVLVAALQEPTLVALHDPSLACLDLLALLYAKADVHWRASMRGAGVVSAAVMTHQHHATSERMAFAACKVYALTSLDDRDEEGFQNLFCVLLATWDALWSQMAALTAEAVLSVFVALLRGTRDGNVTRVLLDRACQLHGVLWLLSASKSVAVVTLQLCCELSRRQDAAELQCLIDAGFVPTLLDVMDRYPDDAEMHHRALYVIASVLQVLPSRSALVRTHILGNGGMGTLSVSACAHAHHGGVLRCIGIIMHHSASQGDAVAAALVRAGGAHITQKLLRVVPDMDMLKFKTLCTAVGVAATLVPHMSPPLRAETAMLASVETALRALLPTLQSAWSDDDRALASSACEHAAMAIQLLRNQVV